MQQSGWHYHINCFDPSNGHKNRIPSPPYILAILEHSARIETNVLPSSSSSPASFYFTDPIRPGRIGQLSQHTLLSELLLVLVRVSVDWSRIRRIQCLAVYDQPPRSFNDCALQVPCRRVFWRWQWFLFQFYFRYFRFLLPRLPLSPSWCAKKGILCGVPASFPNSFAASRLNSLRNINYTSSNRYSVILSPPCRLAACPFSTPPPNHFILVWGR